jgi:hypothetical protein
LVFGAQEVSTFTITGAGPNLGLDPTNTTASRWLMDPERTFALIFAA